MQDPLMAAAAAPAPKLMKIISMQEHTKHKGICKKLLGMLALMLCGHIIISSSKVVSSFPRLQLSWIRTTSPGGLHAVLMNNNSEQTMQSSSCAALHHKAITWIYKNEKEMLQAASHASFNATNILMNNGQNHKYVDNIYTNCIGSATSNNFSTNDANKSSTKIKNVCNNLSLTPRVAFLFLVRGTVPHEALWRRFFATSPDQNLYSVYVHANPRFRFPRSSFFHCKHIPSADVARFSFSVVDAMRRLLAHSLLDASANNQRFVFVCEATIPIRSFPYTYNYLINSNLSYVQAFKPPKEYLSWSTLPVFSSKYLRKGEMWMSLTRHHASMIVGDVALYKKFKAKCKRAIRVCTPDEQYIQTLLSLQDASGVANKTIMFVDWWSHASLEKGSPSSFSKTHVCAALIQNMKRLRQPLRLLKPRLALSHDSSGSCDVSGLPCLDFSSVPYLFARKFTKDSAAALSKLSPEVLGY